MIFDKIVGNEDVKSFFKNALKNNNLSNSLLFSGPDGIGKSLFAKAIAASLMYPDGVSDVNLKKIDQENHPDLHVYKPEGKTQMHLISSVRNLIEEVHLAAFEAKAKVFIILDAERMQPVSFNALLKTLEEPTFDSFIILITSSQEDILPTILSRCAKISFNLIEDEKIEKFVIEKFQKQEADAKRIARLSFGTIANAISIINSQKRKNQNLLKILSKRFSSYFEFQDLLKKIEEENQNFKDVNFIFLQILMWYRDLYLLKEKADEKFLFFYEEKKLLKDFYLKKIPKLENVFSYIQDAKKGVGRNIKLTHALENVFLKLIF